MRCMSFLASVKTRRRRRRWLDVSPVAWVKNASSSLPVGVSQWTYASTCKASNLLWVTRAGGAGRL